jgi:hypothetical protein
MFGDGIRVAGLDLLSQRHIREGLPLCLSLIEPNRWGLKGRLENYLEYLTRYGTHAQAFLPELQALRPKLGDNQNNLALVDKTIAAIQTSKLTPKLVDVKTFIAQAAASGK